MREQRLIFGEVAELYDRARAGYPEAMVDDVLDLLSDRARIRSLEIGAGTGKATVAFARRGIEILAIEPDEAMAAVARRNCRPFSNVKIEISTFEDWPPEADRFDLVFAAQAWHWVKPEIRYRKAAEVLSTPGTLALFWHRTQWGDEDLRDELDELYRNCVPKLYEENPGFPGLTTGRADHDLVEEVRRSGFFDDVSLRSHSWSTAFTEDSFVEVLLTQSNHRLLPENTRAELFDAIRRIIRAHGGEVVVPMATDLVLARLR